MIKILVVTATLGNRPSLQKTIESVRQINYEGIKHIIIAPKEKTEEIKNKFNIECIEEPKNSKGIYAALNYAFFLYGKDFDYLTFINDDDYWLPKFKNLIEYIHNNPTIDFIYSKAIYIDKNDKIIKYQSCSNQFKYFINLFHYNIILLTQQTTLLRSNLFFQIGGFDETYKLVSDTKFWIQLSLLKPQFKYLNEFTACYTLQSGQLSNDKELQLTEHNRLKKEFPIKKSITNLLLLIIYRFSNIRNYLTRLF